MNFFSLLCNILLRLKIKFNNKCSMTHITFIILFINSCTNYKQVQYNNYQGIKKQDNLNVKNNKDSKNNTNLKCKAYILFAYHDVGHIYGSISIKNCKKLDEYFYIAEDYCQKFDLHAIYLQNNDKSFDKKFVNFQCIKLIKNFQ